ncbi:MAG: flagellar biosynthetic protein FliR [Myxococcota bacterium]
MTAPALLPELWSRWVVENGADVNGWLLAWARVSPTLALVPFFGGAALPVAARAGLGFALAVAIAPALRPVALEAPLSIGLAIEAARGLPVALAAAVLVHIALMVGGVIDDLRGARNSAALPVFDSEHSPLGALFGLLVAIALLETGAPARLLGALAQVTPSASWHGVVASLAAASGIAVAVAAPVVGVAVILSVAEALLARSAAPAHVTQLLGPLRSVVLLAVVALALDRIEVALLLAVAK